VTHIAFPVFTFLNLVYSIRGFVMNFVTKFLSVLGLTVALSTNAVAAVVLVTDNNGTLMGASGVNVGGTLYDVTFGDGFLDASAITAFIDIDGAYAASQALLDQVLLGVYDDISLPTNGCDLVDCIVITAYRVQENRADYVAAFNYEAFFDNNEGVADGISVMNDDTTQHNYVTIARWAPVAAVPEPETYAMFLAGLGLLGFVSRRRKQKAAV